MIGRMVLQGMAAAAVIAGAAGIYAANAGVGQVSQGSNGAAATATGPQSPPDNGYLAPRERLFGAARADHDGDDDHDRRGRSAKAFSPAAPAIDNGYLVPPQRDGHEGRRGKRHDD